MGRGAASHHPRGDGGVEGVRYRRPDAGYRIPDAGCRIPDAGYRRPEAGYQMPDAGCRMSSEALFRPFLRCRAGEAVPALSSLPAIAGNRPAADDAAALHETIGKVPMRTVTGEELVDADGGAGAAHGDGEGSAVTRTGERGSPRPPPGAPYPRSRWSSQSSAAPRLGSASPRPVSPGPGSASRP